VSDLFALDGVDLQTLGVILQGVGAVISATLAFIVYRLTKVLAKSESVRALNDGWSDYDMAMLKDGNIELFNSFLENTLEETKEYDGYGEKKIHFLLYLLLNSLNNNFYAEQSGAVSENYTGDILDDYLKLLLPRQDYINALLADRGYDPPFKKFVAKRFKYLEKKHS
tara:strand:- start:472 stop:975 length:504 start_codon:yes stop_codon:yes gene_type:complete